jgi:hypothetical protein
MPITKVLAVSVIILILLISWLIYKLIQISRNNKMIGLKIN